MSKTLTITLNIEIDDLPDSELAENAALSQCSVDDLPRLGDVEPGDIADCIAGTIQHSEELFAGSDMHIRATDVRVIGADWK